MLEKETEKAPVKPVSDEPLFDFACEPNWKDKLNLDTLKRVKSLIKDYHEALKRIRHTKHISTDMKRKSDIYRILFARGQEKEHTVDELYSVFDNMTPYQMRKARLRLEEVNWHFISKEERERTLYYIFDNGYFRTYADALELGTLQTEKYVLPPEKAKVLQNLDLNGVPFEVVGNVVAYYEVSKQPDSEWVVLPVANFDCYYGNTNFSKKWLSKIPDTILIRDVSSGISRIKVNI